MFEKLYMKKFIVVTSIFYPTEAIKKLDNIANSSLIVVGDKKTPNDYSLKNGIFMSAQNSYGFCIEKKLPFNHYSRKMLGYLYAMYLGADIILETDDDNIPFDDWDFPKFQGEYEYVPENSGFVNIYSYFTNQKIWPRGLPLNKINDMNPVLSSPEKLNIGVWQGLADEDPDVDAIYRLTNNQPCYFDKTKQPIVLKKGSICPFNTQNTSITKYLFPLMYLPTTVTFRFTDILRGLVFQPLMWHYGYCLGFTTASVLQKRNEHNYMKDFVSEIPCYLDAQKVIEITQNSIVDNYDIYQNLYETYKNLYKNNIVKEDELDVLSAWINDCKHLLESR